MTVSGTATAFPEQANTAAPGGNVVEIDRIYYRFPLGDSFAIQAGPLTRNTEMMGYKASAYAKGSKILDFFGGSLGTPGVEQGDRRWLRRHLRQQEASGEGRSLLHCCCDYVADSGEANDSNPNTGGFMTDNPKATSPPRLPTATSSGASLVVIAGQCGAKFRTATEFAAGDKFGTLHR